MKYIYVISGIIIYMCIGSVYAWSVFRKPLEQLLNISSTQSGLPYTLMLLFFSLSMPFGGRLLQRVGVLKTVLPGAVLVGVGLALSGVLQNITAVSVFYGLVGGIGVGLIYGVPIAVVARWFPERKGTFMGLTLAGFGLSPFVTAPLSRWLIDLYGPFETLKILGALYFAVIAILSFVLRFPPEEGTKTVSATTPAVKSDQNELTSGEMLKTKEFYGLWVCYTIGTLVGLTMIGITSPFAQEVVNLSKEQAAIFVSVFSVFNALGRPLFGYFVDKMKSFKTIVLLFLIIITLSILGIFIRSNAVALFFIVFAMAYMILGGWLATAPATTSAFFGMKNFSSNYGIVFTAYGTGAVVGNLISGGLKDTLGSYSYIFYPTLILGVVGLIVAALTISKKGR